MLNNSLYKKFEQAVTGYSIAQIEVVTKEQMADFMGVDSMAIGDNFFKNVKIVAKRVAVERKLIEAKNAIAGLLSAELPDTFLETDSIGGKDFVKVYPNGNPYL